MTSYGLQKMCRSSSIASIKAAVLPLVICMVDPNTMQSPPITVAVDIEKFYCYKGEKA